MKRWLPFILGLAAMALALRVVGAPLATLHVKTVTGRAEVGEFRCWNCHGPQGALSFDSGSRYPDPRFLATSNDGGYLYVTCGPIRKLARIEVETGSVELSAAYPGRPRGVAVSRDGSLVAVTLGQTDQVVLVNSQSLALEAVIDVGTEPTGVTFNGAGDRLFVANTGSGDISIVGFDDAETRASVFPPMTAVCQDAAGLGAQAAAELLRIINTEGNEVVQRQLPTFFEVSRSTGPPNEALAE